MRRLTIVSRGKLKVIAQRAMTQRGLLPNFSSEGLVKTDAIVTAAAETYPPKFRGPRDVGDRVCIKITDTNVGRGFIDFTRLRLE